MAQRMLLFIFTTRISTKHMTQATIESPKFFNTTASYYDYPIIGFHPGFWVDDPIQKQLILHNKCNFPLKFQTLDFIIYICFDIAYKTFVHLNRLSESQQKKFKKNYIYF